MRLWRISNYRDLSGEGGRRVDGRWHHKGRPVVYLADHPSSALLERLVHLEIDVEDLPTNYQLLGIEVPDTLAMEELSLATIEGGAPGWRASPNICRNMAKTWFEKAPSALLRVPSAISPYSFNFLLNPMHPDAGQVSVTSMEKVDYNSRLFATLTKKTGS